MTNEQRAFCARGVADLAARLLPSPLADDLREYADDVDFAADIVRRYLTADAVSQADMLAFHMSNGVEGLKDADERLGSGE